MPHIKQKLNRETFTAGDIPSLHKRYAQNYKEQRMAYYSAVSIERSVRDIFDDGEDEFDRLKGDAWHGINTTYWKDYEDGYTRLNAVLEKITSTNIIKFMFAHIIRDKCLMNRYDLAGYM